MATRSLPKKTNPLIVSDVCPPYEDLLARRRLGKTNLSVKPAQIGTSNATKPENLGMFEYAHLRAPLPKDLKGSELFQVNAGTPDAYFLMRRSKDGYVSATGMFKIAFPWAKAAEEKLEREYLKSREGTSTDEVAGNIWISPMLALELSREYQMFPWVKALLDPEEIVQSPASAKKHITPPPKFEMPVEQPSLAPPAASPPRARTRRSASPSKIASPTKKVVSPRKRLTKAVKEANAAQAAAASETLQAALDTAASETTEPVEKMETEEDKSEVLETTEASEDKVKIEVESTTDVKGDVETTTTNVTVEMPAGSPELPLPEDTEKMIAEAKRMVEEARKLEAEKAAEPTKAPKKRKVEETIEEGEAESELPAPPAKKTRVLEEKLKREKVRNRALIGVTATLAIAAAIPYFF